jgi:hypothetical protein
MPKVTPITKLFNENGELIMKITKRESTTMQSTIYRTDYIDPKTVEPQIVGESNCLHCMLIASLNDYIDQMGKLGMKCATKKEKQEDIEVISLDDLLGMLLNKNKKH